MKAEKLLAEAEVRERKFLEAARAMADILPYAQAARKVPEYKHMFLMLAAMDPNRRTVYYNIMAGNEEAAQAAAEQLVRTREASAERYRLKKRVSPEAAAALESGCLNCGDEPIIDKAATRPALAGKSVEEVLEATGSNEGVLRAYAAANNIKLGNRKSVHKIAGAIVKHHADAYPTD